MVPIKIASDYFLKQKNRKKYVKNTQKSSFFLQFFGLKFENFPNWIHWFDSIFKELLYAVFRLEKFLLLPEIFRKKLKNSYIIKTDISRKLWHGSFPNFDNSQLIKFNNFYCLYIFSISDCFRDISVVKVLGSGRAGSSRIWV